MSNGIMPFTVTDEAVRHLKELLAERDEYTALRICIKPSEATGMAYSLSFVSDPQPHDKCVCGDLPLLINPNDAVLINGLVLDYQVGPHSEGLVFDSAIIPSKHTCR
jgi:Fe-S cluster assembly iron-binding protein IscA